MRIRLAIPDNIITPSILDSVLEASTKANEALLAAGQAPLIQDAIRDGLKWRPEAFTDGEHFDLSTEAAVRGWGDCDDLAPWLAGQLRLQGDPGAVAFTRKSGPGRYHALVRTGNGEIVDPSLWAGMKKRSNGLPPSVTGPIACVGDGALAVVPHPLTGGYMARCDLPYGARHLAGYGLATTPEMAARRAVASSTVIGEAAGIIGEADIDALAYMLDGLCEDVDGDRGAEVGSFLDSIASLATAVAPAAALIPGIGPVAAAALPVAGSLLSNLAGGKKGAPPPPPPPYAVPNQSGVPVLNPNAAPMPPATGTQTFPTLPVPGGGGMHSFPMPGGGHVAYNPSQPGPIIVRF